MVDDVLAMANGGSATIDVNSQNASGETALHAAAVNGYVYLVEKLLAVDGILHDIMVLAPFRK